MKWLIIGLGNPGGEYEHTPHNAGRAAVSTFVEHQGFSAWSSSSGTQAQYAHGGIDNEDVEAILSDTFMNRSGEAARYAAKKHEVTPERIIVVHDDIDLPLGAVRISHGRGSGGHKGVESIVRALKTRDFVRVRIGVCPKNLFGVTRKPHNVESFVVKQLKSRNRDALAHASRQACGAIEMIIRDGVERAMNEFN